jgi:16S rRNA (uracil1498-N3)-methyltransferase
MDWIIEKACESGAVGIWPVQAKRSVVKLSGERLEKRHQHWYKVAIAACCQSGRAQLPNLNKTTSLLETLNKIKSLHQYSVLWWLSPRGEEFAHTCFFSHRKRRSANDNAAFPLRIVIAIGPEGGWDSTEEQMAVDAGFMPVKLATATLRTETAALFTIAQIQAWSVLAEAPIQG